VDGGALRSAPQSETVRDNSVQRPGTLTCSVSFLPTRRSIMITCSAKRYWSSTAAQYASARQGVEVASLDALTGTTPAPHCRGRPWSCQPCIANLSSSCALQWDLLFRRHVLARCVCAQYMEDAATRCMHCEVALRGRLDDKTPPTALDGDAAGIL
jgi:hypothetical protein